MSKTNVVSPTTKGSEVERFVMRPGSGWKNLKGPIWQHTSGTRVHVMGIVRLPDKTVVSVNESLNRIAANRMIRINGGNRKRGLMALALNLASA